MQDAILKETSGGLPLFNIDTIREAAVTLRGHIRHTELIHSHYFSERLGYPVYFKCENLQRTGSFKVRGATNFIAHQSEELLHNGVISASAGNHAQGVAFASSQAGIKSIVVMPTNTPLAKVLATRDYGAEIRLHGADYDEAASLARQLEEERGMLYVPAFDHELVMAGQGTIGLEILEDLYDVKTILVPIGGGGLISGIATATKSIKPDIRVVGVEAACAPAAFISRRKGQIVPLKTAHSLADGIVVKQLGQKTFPVIEETVDDIVTVKEEEIAHAIVSLMEKANLVVEGSGAVGLAALLSGHFATKNGKTVVVLSGGNIDLQTISRVVERGMLAEGRYLKVRVDLLDTPGALASLAHLVAELGANIFHVSHDRRTTDVPLGRAEVHLELETKGPAHIEEVLTGLLKSGYGARVLK
ncbi:MAG: threonine ammonia-lyase [Deltaproteobacteria bacterium]|jgi:threonine dehydratase|nr:threonine ammonia-lyase [Deltaproteobacteria bacterium]